MIINFFIQEARIITIFVAFFQQDPLILFFKLSGLAIAAALVWALVVGFCRAIVFTWKNPQEAASRAMTVIGNIVINLTVWAFVIGGIFVLAKIGFANLILIFFVFGLIIVKVIGGILITLSAPATVGSNLMTGMMISDAIRDQNRRY